MDCAALKHIFAGDRQEDLTPAEAVAFEAHLDACAACREGLADAEGQLDALAGDWAPPEPDDAAWARVTRAVETQAARGVARGRPSGAPALLAAAAGLLLAFGITLLAVFSSGEPGGVPSSTSGIPPAPIAEVSIEAGEGFEASYQELEGGVWCVVVQPKQPKRG